jgi:hypothetical protein
MSPELEVVATLIGLFGLGGFFLVGLKMVLTHRARHPLGGGEDLRALRDEVNGLREDVLAVRGDLAELSERMDFTERVLAQNRQQEERRLPDR